MAFGTYNGASVIKLSNAGLSVESVPEFQESQNKLYVELCCSTE
jgi:hypothetical protein